MLKVLSFLMAALIPTIALADATTIDRGSWRPFTQEFVFEGTVAEADKDLTFWVSPDAEYVNAVRKKADQISTAYVVRSPLLIKVKLAGVVSDTDTGIALSKDDFDDKAQADIRGALLKKNYQFRCYGNFANYIVPFCSAIDTQGNSAAVGLTRLGLVKMDGDFIALTDLELHLMTDAQKQAQDDGIGIWKPFRMMLRGLK